MGTPYNTTTITGFNSNPPPDGGEQTAANLVTWAKHKEKLADPVKTALESMNTKLVEALDSSASLTTTNYTVVAADHDTAIEIAPDATTGVTITIPDAATITSLFRVYIKNSSAHAQTIARATGGDTIDGTAADITLPPGAGILLTTNSAADGYLVAGRTGPFIDTSVKEDFGATGDGTTDDTAAIQAAIDAAEAAGGGRIYFPPGTYEISSTLVINDDHVVLSAAGNPASHDGGASQKWSVRLLWAGAANGTMLRVTAVSGASNQSIEGCGVEGFFFDGALTAQTGLEVISHRFGRFRNLMFTKLSGDYCLKTNVVATLSAGEAKDTQNNQFENISFRQNTGEGTSHCMRLDGDGTGNTSLNLFRNIAVFHANTTVVHGIVLGDSDNNLFELVRCHRSAGTGVSVIFEANASATKMARSNEFKYLFAEGGVTAQGTETATNESYNNRITHYDTENGSPDPSIGTDATLQWETEYQQVDTGALGWVKLANGLVMQWGTATVGANATVVVTLQVPLTVGARSIQVTARESVTTAQNGVTGEPVSTTQINVTNTMSNTRTLDWFCIGV